MRTDRRMFHGASLISAGTLSSRLLGLLREMLMAWSFGTGLAGSAFFVAFTIPNLFRRLFGEGALSAAFVPHYVQLRQEKGDANAAQLIRAVANWLLRVLGTLSLLGMLVCGWILWRFQPSPKTEMVLRCLQILFPYMIVICLAALMMGVLNAHRRYLVSAFSPCLLNLVWIIALLGLNRFADMQDLQKVEYLSLAILLAGFLQYAVQWLAVRKLLPPSTASANGTELEVRTVLRRMGPAAMGAAVVQVNVLADRLLAFWTGTYGPAALTYAERLIYLPLGVFATALGTILLPEFSRLTGSENRAQIDRMLDRGLRGLNLIMIPASLGLALTAEPLVRLMFQRGAFNAESTLFTTRALWCYAPGLWVFSLAKVFVPLFHAHGDTRTPMRSGVVAVGVNLLLNLLLVFTLPAGWKHAGLAAGTVVSVLLQILILAVLAQRRGYVRLHRHSLLPSLTCQFAACLPLGAVVLLLPGRLSFLPEVVGLLTTIAAAAAVYLLTLRLLRCPEWREWRGL